MCERLELIRKRIEQAAKRANRDPSRIQLVAVSKKKPVSMIRELYECGQRAFGENYIQEGVEKIEALSDLKDISWHFIGHLQRNKAKFAARYFDWVETVDSLRLARTLDKKAKEAGRKLNILLQVNIGREGSKSGLLEEDVEGVLRQIRDLSNLTVKGLMTIPPRCRDKEEARPWFRKMKSLLGKLRERYPGLCLFELSMGMSGDFEIAIEEGATIVRIGTALFGPRD